MEAFDKLHQIRAAQNEILVSREQEIDGVWLTFLSGQHGFFYGVPGVAKSMIVEDAARHLGSKCFTQLMSKSTMPEDLYGPVSIKALKDDRYEHQINGYLPTADFAFLDEGFKAGAAILNTLLRLINERQFRHGTDMIHVPLRSLFIASNEIPQEAELAALHDRILFRFNVEELNNSTDFATLLSKEAAITAYLKAPPVTIISMEEFVAMRDAVDAVVVPPSVLAQIVDIRDTLGMDHQITASSRRWLRTLSGVRAHAAMHGRTEAIDEDLAVLTFMLWDQLSEIPAVREVVWNIANPILFLIKDIKDDITKALDDMDRKLDAAQGNESTLLLQEYSVILEDIGNRVIVARETLTKTQRDKFDVKLKYMQDVVEGARVRLAVQVGGIDAKAVLDNTVAWKPETV